MLKRHPGFTIVAALTIALGVGANAAMFSVLSAVLLRPLPFPDPSRLVELYQAPKGTAPQPRSVSLPDFQDWEKQNRTFDSLGGYQLTGFTVTGAGEPAIIPGAAVTSGFFRVLRAQPLRGRELNAADDDPGSPAVVVIGETLWRERYASDPDVLSKSLELDGALCRIVGVVRGDFRYPYFHTPLELWVPFREAQSFRALIALRSVPLLDVIGRLPPGVRPATARADITAIQAGLHATYSPEQPAKRIEIVPLQRAMAGNDRSVLWLLMLAVFGVLLISCVNVSCLLLARTTSRAKELAVRLSLGAARRALVLQLLTESLTLALLGGAIGIVLAYLVIQGMQPLIPATLAHFGSIDLDQRVLVFSIAVSLLCGLIFGVGPALRPLEESMGGSLNSSTRGSTHGRGRQRLLSLLVASEVTIAMVLLTLVALLVQSLTRLQSIDPGFRAGTVVKADLELPRSRYSSPQQWGVLSHRLLDAISTAPGVQQAALAVPLPFTPSTIVLPVAIEGREANSREPADAYYSSVSPAYFRLMGIPLIAGRTFDKQDGPASAGAAIVDEAFVQRYLGGREALGQVLVFGFPHEILHHVVGIVGNTKNSSLAEASLPHMYVPFAQEPLWAMSLLLSGPGGPEQLGRTAAAVVHDLDPDVPVAQVFTLNNLVRGSTAELRFRTTMTAIFGLLALLLAAVGIYGVLANAVSERVPEIGIRMALGARRGDILRLIVGRGMRMILVGVVLGAILGLPFARLFQHLLFSVQPVEPLALCAAACVLCLVGFVACYLPARQAMATDASTALRRA